MAGKKASAKGKKQKVGRPGGRSEEKRKAVATAVLSLIKAGRADFEIQEVSALSGVHRTTLFRRWPDRVALFVEAMDEHVSRVSMKATGDWEKDLRAMAFQMRDFFRDPVEMSMHRILVASDNAVFVQQMVDHWMPLIDASVQILKDGQRAGALSQTVNAQMVVRVLLSTLLAATLFTRTPVEDDFVDELVDQTIRGCTPPIGTAAAQDHTRQAPDESRTQEPSRRDYDKAAFAGKEERTRAKIGRTSTDEAANPRNAATRVTW